MSNTILTPTAVTREALRILHNNLAISSNVDRQYDSSFAKSGAKIGTTLKVRKPNQFTVRTGAGLNAQDITETSETITVATQKGVDINFTTAELTLEMDDFSDRILKPAMARLAAEIDVGVAALFKDVYQTVGTWGTTPATALVILQAKQKLTEGLTPIDDSLTLCVNAAAEAAIVNALKGLFQQSNEIASQYVMGKMGRSLGFNWFCTENVPTLTAGTADNTTPTVNGASQTGASLITQAWDSSATLKAGQVFSIANVYKVNPETKVTTTALQQFVVTADVTASGGAATLAISPSIITSGATQTVDSSPANSAAITILETASQVKPMNLAFHKEAFTLVTADLEMPGGVDFASRQVQDGISMRIVRQYDINSDKIPCRLDVLYGVKTLRPEFACRIQG